MRYPDPECPVVAEFMETLCVRFTLGLLAVMTFGASAISQQSVAFSRSRVIRAQRKANVRLRGHPHVQLHSRFRKHARGFAVPMPVPCEASS
jgi:hypothetical protein